MVRVVGMWSFGTSLPICVRLRLLFLLLRRRLLSRLWLPLLRMWLLLFRCLVRVISTNSTGRRLRGLLLLLLLCLPRSLLRLPLRLTRLLLVLLLWAMGRLLVTSPPVCRGSPRLSRPLRPSSRLRLSLLRCRRLSLAGLLAMRRLLLGLVFDRRTRSPLRRRRVLSLGLRSFLLTSTRRLPLSLFGFDVSACCFLYIVCVCVLRCDLLAFCMTSSLLSLFGWLLRIRTRACLCVACVCARLCTRVRNVYRSC